MADGKNEKLRKLLKTLIGAAIVVVGLFAALLFRDQVGQGARWTADIFEEWITVWAPAHQSQAAAVLGFAVVAFFINWIAHRRGRLLEWLLAVVVEFGIWILFWYAPFVPSLNELTGLNITQMDFKTVMISGGAVVAVTGLIFWFLELREEWRKIRGRKA